MDGLDAAVAKLEWDGGAVAVSPRPIERPWPHEVRATARLTGPDDGGRPVRARPVDRCRRNSPPSCCPSTSLSARADGPPLGTVAPFGGCGWSPASLFSAVRVPISHPKPWDMAVVDLAQLGVFGLLLGPDLLHVTPSGRSPRTGRRPVRVCSADNVALSPFVRCHQAEYADRTSTGGGALADTSWCASSSEPPTSVGLACV